MQSLSLESLHIVSDLKIRLRHGTHDTTGRWDMSVLSIIICWSFVDRNQQKLVDYTPSPICYVSITLEIEMLNCCVLSSHILLLTATDGSVSYVADFRTVTNRSKNNVTVK